MKVYPARMTDLKDSHNQHVEQYVANWLADVAGWSVLYAPTGRYFPDWDFVLTNSYLWPPPVARCELKVLQKGTNNAILEVSKLDGSPSGITATRADVYVFISIAGTDAGKVRLIRTAHLLNYARRNTQSYQTIHTKGDKIGSTIVPFSFADKTIPDLMLAEVGYDATEKSFDLSNPKYNDFGKAKLFKMLTTDSWL